jgi:tol-pal system protein YbgF
MKRWRALVTAIPLALLLALGLLGGCASSGDDPEGDRIKELQDRVLELQRKAAVAEVELARLRQQVADLQAKQGPGVVSSGSSPAASGGGSAASGTSGANAARPSGTLRGAMARRPAAAEGSGAASARPPAAADRAGSAAAPPPARPAGAGRGTAIDEMDIDVPAPQSTQPYPSSPAAPSIAGSNRRPAAVAPTPPPQPAPAVPTPASPVLEGKREPVTPAVQALYDRGYTLYHQKHYVDAEASFQRFLQAEPNSELADNAQYWIGECRYSRGDMRGALAAFRETVARYPVGNKTADALLKAGMSLENLGDKEGARNTYQEVLKRFPGTAVAAVAEERRAKLP